MTKDTAIRDHGGNLDAAMARFGGDQHAWLDLSTGINPAPYPVPNISADSWAALPRKIDQKRLIDAARVAYGTKAEIVAFAGAQGAIQAMPFLSKPGRARVVTPTYNEHRGALETGGWDVADVPDIKRLAGADLAVIVNPNNPDGRGFARNDLARIATEVGILIVDESFADPGEILAPETDALAGDPMGDLPQNTVVLRSFGKFYGLAGIRLGFALAKGPLADRLSALAGPWPVSGPAIDIAEAALRDRAWQRETAARLRADAARLDQLAHDAGWVLVGGTALFRTYDVGDAPAVQDALAGAPHHIWTRIFPYSPSWVRLGLPPANRWTQLGSALRAL